MTDHRRSIPYSADCEYLCEVPTKELGRPVHDSCAGYMCKDSYREMDYSYGRAYFDVCELFRENSSFSSSDIDETSD